MPTPLPAPRYTPPVSAGRGSYGSVHGPNGGIVSGSRQSGVVAGPGGGVGVGGRLGGTYVGPAGGVGAGGSRGGTYVAPGGTAVSGGSRGGAASRPGGSVVVGGAKGGTISGPGGNSVSAGKSGAAVIGPNGNVHATGSKGAAVVGPGGSSAWAGRGSVSVGPGGARASGGKVGVATGPGGAVAGGNRAAVAVGPYGGVAAGKQVGYRGTRYVPPATLRNQGVYVRSSFGHYRGFTPAWYARYPGAWVGRRLVTASLWAVPVWGTCVSFCGYPANVAAVNYEYGGNVTYVENNVYYGDQLVASQPAYAQQASAFADAGRAATPPPDDQWQPLGVFAMVQGDETTSNSIFQLALDSAGVVRGNYYDAVADTNTPVFGSLDKNSQRVAWTIGTNKEPVYETGLYNLTQDESTMLVHFGTERPEQYRLFRLEQPGDGQ